MRNQGFSAGEIFTCLIISLLAVELESSFEESIYHYLPEESLSYCSRKLNISNQVGCSSKLGGSAGVLWMANSSSDVILILSESVSRDIMLALDFHLFINVSLMRDVRSSPLVSGLLVFAPLHHVDVPTFSESSGCPNSESSFYGPQRECNVTPMWNPAGSGYSSIDWPFPVALVQDPNNLIKNALLSCFSQFNVHPMDDTRCTVEINSPMSAVHSSTVCNRRQYLMSLQVFKEPDVFCDELTGVNIVLSTSNTSHQSSLTADGVTSNNVTTRAPNSSLLVLSRMDARSMFERSGFGSEGVLPGLAVLLSTAVHLLRQPAFKLSQLKRDLFFVFLDNEAYNFMGAGRLNYDLHEELLARYTGYPLGWKHVYAVIELGELGLPTNGTDGQPTYFMLSDRSIHNQDSVLFFQTTETTNRLMDQLAHAAERQGQLLFQQADDFKIDLPLPPTASLQFLLSSAPTPLAHLYLSDYVEPPMTNPYFESFLDKRWPPPKNLMADQQLLNLANTLSDALYMEVVRDASPIPEKILTPTPGDFMECFVHDPNCSLFRRFLNPSDITFLASLNSPLPTQTYLPLGDHELKLSHLINVLLMGLTGELTEKPSCPEYTGQPYVYLMGYFNGSEHCYRTMLDLATRFVLFRRGQPISPAWVRSRLVTTNRYIRWYRHSSFFVDHVSLALGILLIIMAAICAFQLRPLLNIHASQATTLDSIERESPAQPGAVNA
ncbi:Ubiquitin carboxyl-terminal hydrolase isozyme L5 [Fasciola hepatica]|uniref:Nicastrin n=1 Tax=Fasciola hepatica TaxID=6192 RepID=A0A4E0QYE1_FASHE|nr:Ubiquitin carboxyl-terminal hydrolase isozyme L5 [Fasciola hepatica]